MPKKLEKNDVLARIEIGIGDSFFLQLPAAIAGLTTVPPTGVVKRLRNLADDLAAIQRGEAPTPSQISAAPRLEHWGLIVSPAGIRLAGFAAGHPRFGSRPIVTSPVWCISPSFKWARTLSRLYGLGAPSASTAATPGPGKRPH
jgi:hypothetical protein